MCINPNYCDSECNCEQCREPYWVKRPRLCDLPRSDYRFDKNWNLISIRPEKKVVSQEGRDKFIEGQFKIVSEMGRKFYRKYRGTESVNNEFKRQNRKNRKII